MRAVAGRRGWRDNGRMRRMLRIFLSLGLGLSTILLVGTGVLWVRSLGQREGLDFDRFEPRPDWTTPGLPGNGTWHWWYAAATHGRLEVGSETVAPWPESKPRNRYSCGPISADEAKERFDSSFQPGERQSNGGIERAWRFAGGGFRHYRNTVDPRIAPSSAQGFDLAIPFWMLAVVFGLWPVGFLARRVLRRRRYGAGLCPSCGYDLRATPDRCPECGRVMSNP